MRIPRNCEAVMHPLAFSPRSDQSCPPEIGEMARNLRLRRANHFNEVTDADFLLRHEVDQAQSRRIGKCPE